MRLCVQVRGKDTIYFEFDGKIIDRTNALTDLTLTNEWLASSYILVRDNVIRLFYSRNQLNWKPTLWKGCKECRSVGAIFACLLYYGRCVEFKSDDKSFWAWAVPQVRYIVIYKQKWENLQYPQAYSYDIAPSDFFLVWSLKKKNTWEERIFKMKRGVIDAVTECFN